MPHPRKRARARAHSDNNSVVTAESTSSNEYSNQTTSDRLYNLLTEAAKAHDNLTQKLADLYNNPDFNIHDLPEQQFLILPGLLTVILQILKKHPDHLCFNELCDAAYTPVKEIYDLFHPASPKVDVSISTEPIPETPKPTYASVAAQADTPTPSPPVQPQGSSPGPSPIPTQFTPTGSGPPVHSPKPPVPKPRNSARPTGTPPKSPFSDPPKSKSGQQVRLVACIANRPDAATTDHPRYKAFPTDCFTDLSKTLKSSAPGCVPLGFRLNRKGNIVITFTPTTPRSLLMSNLWIIRGAFELSHNVPILLDTTWSTIHLANVPTRSIESAPVFDQAEIAATLQNNPALAALPITLQPRWLRHPSKISGPRSSVVFSFEDPDGAIARQLLKTPTFMFGQPVTVKPWINKPASTARPPPSVSVSVFRVSAVTNECSSMDLN